MAADQQHKYLINLVWTGNKGPGTTSYKAYARDHEITTSEKLITIPGSSDPAFRGDPTRYNPEEMLVAALSSCHMLWYLHLCAQHHIIVTSYEDNASGVMQENPDGSGQFESVTLQPRVRISNKDQVELATKLHEQASEMCFIARSCNFQIEHKPIFIF